MLNRYALNNSLKIKVAQNDILERRPTDAVIVGDFSTPVSVLIGQVDITSVKM